MSPAPLRPGRGGVRGLRPNSFSSGLLSGLRSKHLTNRKGKQNLYFCTVLSSSKSSIMLHFCFEVAKGETSVIQQDLVGRSAAAPQPQAWAAQGGGSPLPSTRWVWTRLPGDKVSFCWPKLCSPSTPLPLPMVGHPTLPDPAERGVSPSPRLKL